MQVRDAGTIKVQRGRSFSKDNFTDNRHTFFGGTGERLWVLTIKRYLVIPSCHEINSHENILLVVLIRTTNLIGRLIWLVIVS